MPPARSFLTPFQPLDDLIIDATHRGGEVLVFGPRAAAADDEVVGVAHASTTMTIMTVMVMRCSASQASMSAYVPPIADLRRTSRHVRNVPPEADIVYYSITSSANISGRTGVAS
ncbi:MAG: hypothetical protein WA615_20050 [Bradyrhizobium sp.]|uniref:hypothetical protein n=1 Tax=Bradyrhizobium sp. TaxID=376 RepID=UPI003C7A7A3F